MIRDSDGEDPWEDSDDKGDDLRDDSDNDDGDDPLEDEDDDGDDPLEDEDDDGDGEEGGGCQPWVRIAQSAKLAEASNVLTSIR